MAKKKTSKKPRVKEVALAKKPSASPMLAIGWTEDAIKSVVNGGIRSVVEMFPMESRDSSMGEQALRVLEKCLEAGPVKNIYVSDCHFEQR